MASLYLYSTYTWLAYEIGSKYFRNIFYAYTAEEFDPHLTNPNSSNPRVIYEEYLEIMEQQDTKHRTYKHVLETLRGVARNKSKTGEISVSQYKDIQKILLKVRSEMRLFAPVVYVIRRDKVEARATATPIGTAGSVLSVEHLITDLRRDEFEVFCGVLPRIRIPIRNP